MSVLYIVLALVALQRVGELSLATTNTHRLLARGAREIDADGYRWFVVLHAGWLVSLPLTLPANAAPSWALLALFALLQAGRVWVIATLGPRWTTRLIVLPDAPLVRAGPYRYLRHPNYAIVIGEIALLPLAFGAMLVAAVFSVANLALILRRIAIEDRALAPVH